MKPFNEQIDALVKLGYGQPAARAKVAHDAILLKELVNFVASL